MDVKYGKKYGCPACGCRFYDLGKEEAICPRCKELYKGNTKRGTKIKKTKTYKRKAPLESSESVISPRMEDEGIDNVSKADVLDDIVKDIWEEEKT